MDTLVRLWLNACMLEESLFVSIANIRKKPSQTQEAIQHSMTPRYLSVPGIIAKRLGDGVDPVDICDILPPSSVIRREDLPSLGFVP